MGEGERAEGANNSSSTSRPDGSTESIEDTQWFTSTYLCSDFLRRGFLIFSFRLLT